MPYVRCANVIGFSSVGEYAFPGVASPFNITIRNDGNVYLSGYFIRLHKRGAKNNKDDTLTKIVFSKDTLAESNYNPKKSDGTFENVEPDFSLAPGKTSVYSVMLMIPKNWAGKVNASVTAQDFVAAGQAATKPMKGMSAVVGEELSAMADEESEVLDNESSDEDEGAIDFDGGYEGIDYDEFEDEVDYIDYDEYVEPGEETDEEGNVYVDYIVDESDYEDDGLLEYPYDDIEILYSEEVAGEELSDAPVQDPNSDGSGGGDQAATRGSSAQAKTATAKTADSLGGMSGLLGAAAVAGAAMAAYSARRVANERAAAEGAASEDASAPDCHGNA